MACHVIASPKPRRRYVGIVATPYTPAVRQKLLDGINRVAAGITAAAGAPKPVVTLRPDDRIRYAVYNDPGLTKQVAAALATALGPAHVKKIPPGMGGEDFSEYGQAGVPSFFFWVGTVDAKVIAKAQRTGQALPSLHSPRYAPEAEAALRTSVPAVTAAALDLLRRQ
jgi:hippurate hydrolase